MLSRASGPRTWQRGLLLPDFNSLPPLFLCPRLAQQRLRPASSSRLRQQSTSAAPSSSSSSRAQSSKDAKKEQRLRDNRAKLHGIYPPEHRYRFNTQAPPLRGAKPKPPPAAARSLEPWVRADTRAGPKAWRNAFTGGPAFGDEDSQRSGREEGAERSYDEAMAASSENEKLHVVLDLARDLVARPSARLASARTVEPGMEEVLDEAWALLSFALFGHRDAFEVQKGRKATPTATSLSEANQKAGVICALYLSRAAYASSLPVIPRLRAASATPLGPPSMHSMEDLVVDAGKAQDPRSVLAFANAIASIHRGINTVWLLYARARALSTRAARGYDWGSIEGYWKCYPAHRSVKGKELTPPRYLFEFLLHHYVARRDVSAAQQVLRSMAEAGHVPNAAPWLVLLRAHAALRPTVTALASSQWADSSSCSDGEDGKSLSQAQKSTLDDLIGLKANQLDARGALLVLRAFGVPTGGQSRKRGATLPSASTYAPLAQMFSNLGVPHLALRFCSLAFEHGQSSEPEGHRERALLAALNALRRAQLAPQALALACDVLGVQGVPMSAQQSPIALSSSAKPTQRLYAAMLHSASQLPPLQAPDAARAVLLDMFARGQLPGPYVLRSLGYLLFATAANALDWDRAKRSLYTLSAEAVRMRVRRLEGAVEREADKDKLIAKAKRLHRLDNFVRTLDKLGFEDSLVLSGPREPLAAASPQAQHEVRPTQLLQQAKPQPQPQPSAPLSSSPSPPPQRHDKKTAVEHEVDLSVPLRPAGYAMRLRVYAVQRLDHASASALFRAMIQHGISPNMQHIAPLVEGLVEAGQMRDAGRVASRAVTSLGVEATLRIHTALIRGYANQGDWHSVEQQLLKVQATGLPVDSALQEILATARARAREAEGIRTTESDIALLHRPRDAPSTQGLTARLSVLMKAGAYLPAQKLLLEHLTSLQPHVDAMLRREIMSIGNWIKKKVEQQARDASGRYSEELAEAVRTQSEIEAIVARNRAKGRGDANARVGARRKIVKLIFEAVVNEDLKREALGSKSEGKVQA